MPATERLANISYSMGDALPQSAVGGCGQVKPRVAILSFPWKSHSPYKLLSELVVILEPITREIVLIGGNTDRIHAAYSSKIVVRDIGVTMHYLDDIKPKYLSAFLWLFKWFVSQCRASLELARARADVDVVLFYMAYPGYLLPLLVTKLLRKKSIEVVTHGKGTTIISRLWRLQEPMLFALLDGISPESRGLIKELGIEKYGEKVLPEGARFIDVSHYILRKQLSERRNLVGFIGRLTKDKGTVDFINAIPEIARNNADVAFLIAGAGDLVEWVQSECAKIKAQGIDVTVFGWIANNLPECLNELKLIVLPTRYDALPTIVLEAMACGTPVIATPVGAIPDLIKLGETGFLIANGSPECIAETVTKALNMPNDELSRIVENAKAIVDERFTYAAAVKRFEDILALRY
jgi:glycosyltransferase involved in cell wall biosynthesis